MGPVKLFLAPWCHAAAELRCPAGWSCEGSKEPQERKHENERSCSPFSADQKQSRAWLQVHRTPVRHGTRQWVSEVILNTTMCFSVDFTGRATREKKHCKSCLLTEQPYSTRRTCSGTSVNSEQRAFCWVSSFHQLWHETKFLYYCS